METIELNIDQTQRVRDIALALEGAKEWQDETLIAWFEEQYDTVVDVVSLELGKSHLSRPQVTIQPTKVIFTYGRI